MIELFENVYMLEGEVGGRPLQLMYLKGDDASVLFDCGSAGDPGKFIVPQIEEAGGDAAQLDWLIISHPDFDHTGGIHEMKQIAPAATLACGRADEAACTSPDAIIQLRYDAYRAEDHIFYDEPTLEFIHSASGQHQPIELTFVGGETLRLGDDWTLEILHLPGHSRGHLGLLDRKNNALYGGDAVHGAIYYGLDGVTPVFCPTYLHVDDYLNTIRFVEHLPIDTYVGCHWNVKRGGDIANFCAESRDFVVRTEQLLMELLAEPHTLADICTKLGPQVGDWPREVDSELVYALKGHVQRLEAAGRIAVERQADQPNQYQITSV